MNLIRTATEGDIPFIMGTERMPGYEWVVGRWDEALHRREMGRPETCYFIGEREGVPFGFAILRDLDDAFGNVFLKRIAVRERAGDSGGLFSAVLVAAAFDLPQPYRIWLTVAPTTSGLAASMEASASSRRA